MGLEWAELSCNKKSPNSILLSMMTFCWTKIKEWLRVVLVEFPRVMLLFVTKLLTAKKKQPVNR
jgi:hypothetical protein